MPDDESPQPSSDLGQRLRRSLRLVAVFAFAVAMIAVLLVGHGDGLAHVHMLVATGLGVFLSVMLAGGLMLLIFHSSASGHDDAAARFKPDEER